MSSPARQKQMNALLITLHSFLPRETWSDLMDPRPQETQHGRYDPPDEPPSPELLHRPDHSQRE